MQKLRTSYWAKWALACFVSCFIFTASADVIKIVPDATDSVSNGVALTNAIDSQYTAGGGIIYLGAGTFNGNFEIKNGVKIYGGFTSDSSGWIHLTSTRDSNLTICDGSLAENSVFRATAKITDTAILDGLTIQNGRTSGNGGGVNASGDVQVNNCVITKNYAGRNGGATEQGFINNCLITNNTANSNGGGTNLGTVSNCLIQYNKTLNGYGAGCCGGAIYNCVVVYNDAACDGGGMDSIGVAEDCVIWGNTSGDLEDAQVYDVYEENLINCAVQDATVYANKITVSLSASNEAVTGPNFVDVDDISKGVYNYTPILNSQATFLPRVNSGLYLLTLSNATVSPAVTRIEEGKKLTVSAVKYPSLIFNHWEVSGIDVSESDLTKSPLKFEMPANNVSVSAIYEIPLYNDFYYVKMGTDPVQNAEVLNLILSSIQPTDTLRTIYLGEGKLHGNFPLINGVQIYGGFTGDYKKWNHVISVRDSKLTICDGLATGSVFANKTGDIEDLTLLDGLTIQNGNSEDGGGVYGNTKNVIVRNCIVQKNISIDDGGGIYNATVENCIVQYNTAQDDGGGCRNCDVSNSIIQYNTAQDGGGGCRSCDVTNSIIQYNTAQDDGGGCRSCDVTNCIIQYNTAQYGGGGCRSGDVTNSIIQYNTSLTSNGGGMRSVDVAEDCVIWGNTSGDLEHAQVYNVYGANLINCAVQDATADATKITVSLDAKNTADNGPQFVDPKNPMKGLYSYTQILSSQVTFIPRIASPKYRFVVKNATANVTSPVAQKKAVTVNANTYVGATFTHWEATGLDLTPEQITVTPLKFAMPDTHVTINACFAYPIVNDAHVLEPSPKDPVANGKSLAVLIDMASRADTLRTIYLGEGTFKGNFAIQNDVSIYGGFRGPSAFWNHETSSRDCTLTICDGSLEQQSVFRTFNSIDGALLNGLTIQGGFAEYGGGVYSHTQYVVLEQCIIQNNTAKYSGSGVCGASIYSSVIQNNHAEYEPGAACHNTLTSQSVIISNTSTYGYVPGCDASNLQGSIVWGNRSLKNQYYEQVDEGSHTGCAIQDQYDASINLDPSNMAEYGPRFVDPTNPLKGIYNTSKIALESIADFLPRVDDVVIVANVQLSPALDYLYEQRLDSKVITADLFDLGLNPVTDSLFSWVENVKVRASGNYLAFVASPAGSLEFYIPVKMVRLNAPTLTKATYGSTDTSIVLTWKAPKDVKFSDKSVVPVEYYKIYENGSFVDSVPFGELTWTHEYADFNRKFSYTITAVSTDGFGESLPSNVKYAPNAYTLGDFDATATQGTLAGKVKISWPKIASHPNYEVIVKGEPVSKANARGNSFTYNVSPADEGKEIYFTLNIFNADFTDTATAGVYGYSMLAPPKMGKVYANQDMIYFNWKPNPKAVNTTRYVVVRSLSKDLTVSCKYTTVDSPLDIHFDYDAIPGITYYYAVACVGNAQSKYSAPVKGTRLIQDVTEIAASQREFKARIEVRWNEVVGAKSYRVYRSATPSKDDAKPISKWMTTRQFTHNDDDIDYLQNYYYFVAASFAKNGKSPTNLTTSAMGALAKENINYSDVSAGVYFDPLYTHELAFDDAVDSKFTKTPSAYFVYTDMTATKPKAKKYTLNVEKLTHETDSIQLWNQHLIPKYNVKEFKAWTKANKSTLSFIEFYRRSDAISDIYVVSKDRRDGSDFHGQNLASYRKLSHCAPSINYVDSKSSRTISFAPDSELIIEGEYFGTSVPKVWLEYYDETGTLKQVFCRVTADLDKDPVTQSMVTNRAGYSRIRAKVPSTYNIQYNKHTILYLDNGKDLSGFYSILE